MYQTGYAMPAQDDFASSPRTGALGDYIRGVGLALWLFLLIVPFWWLRDYDDIYDIIGSGFDKTMQYAAFGVALVAQLTLGISVLINQSFNFSRTVKGRCLIAFCLLMLATAPLSIDPVRSALYSMVTLAAILACHLVWQADYDRFRRIMLLTAVLLLGYLCVLTVHHGMGVTSVGGIQRNRFGHAAFTGAICLFLYRGKLKWAGFALCIALAILVNSRGTLMACGIFVAAYLWLKFGFGRSLLAILGLSLVGVVLLVMPRVGEQLQDTLVNKVGRLNSSDRGMGSGFSGRTETWAQGLRVFMRSPAIGHGFRTRTTFTFAHEVPDGYSSHSGYVNLLADTGLAGAALMLFAFGYDLYRRTRAIRWTRQNYALNEMPPDVNDSYELNCVVSAFIVAEGVLWLFEPLYINLGSCLSILFLVFAMAPYAIRPGAAQQAYYAAVTSVWPSYRPAGAWD